MNQEEKKLVLKDLCSRLLYKVKVCLFEKETCILLGIDGYEVYLDVDSDSFHIESIKPYLRPMSSMTEEENLMYEGLMIGTDNVSYMLDVIDWLNAHHFDYRGLIEKGLAIEAPEGMYK